MSHATFLACLNSGHMYATRGRSSLHVSAVRNSSLIAKTVLPQRLCATIIVKRFNLLCTSRCSARGLYGITIFN